MTLEESLDELVETFRRKANHCEGLSFRSRIDDDVYRLAGKADGFNSAAQDVEDLLRRIRNPL